MPVTVNGVSAEVATELREFWTKQLWIDLDDYTLTLFLTAISLDNDRVKCIVGVKEYPDISAIFFGTGSIQDLKMCVFDEESECIQTHPFASVGTEALSRQKAAKAVVYEQEISLLQIPCGRLCGQTPAAFKVTSEVRRYAGKKANTLVWDCESDTCMCPRCTKLDYTQCRSCGHQPDPRDMDVWNQCPVCHEHAKTTGLCSNCYRTPTDGKCTSEPETSLPMAAADLTMVALEKCMNDLYLGCGHPNPVKDNVCFECLLDYNEHGMCDVCLAPVKGHTPD